MRMSFVHVQGFSDILLVEPLLHKRKVVAQWGNFAFFAYIVRIQSRHLVGGRQAGVAEEECRLASEIVQSGIPFVALVDKICAAWNDCFHCRYRGVIEESNVVAVRFRHVDVGSWTKRSKLC